RVDLSIDVLKRMLNRGINTKLILLGEGEELLNLKKHALMQQVGDNVLFEGFVHNVTDYLDAANFLIHPSVLESSCVVVKEAAIACLPVIVCNDVGDFDDYILNEVNGYK